jgi:hypothetical protein
MNTLVNYYSEEQKRHSGTFPLPTEYIEAVDKKTECIRKIERILELKELS